MKKGIVIAGLVCGISSVWAGSVSDDFNREDTGYTTSGKSIGEGWNVSASSAKWKLNNSNLVMKPIVNPAVLYNESLKIAKDEGSGFSVKATVSDAAGWVGIVFNYQDASNYYYLRIKTGESTYHFNARINGVDKMLSGGKASTVFTAEQKYTLTVSSTSPYSFSYTITEAGSADALNSNQLVVDKDKQFAAGYAGLYCATGGKDPSAVFDDFQLDLTGAE
jgi:hypothetical protein